MFAKRFITALARFFVLALGVLATLVLAAPSQAAPAWPSGHGPDVSAGPDIPGAAPLVKSWDSVQLPAELKRVLPKDNAPCRAPGVKACVEKHTQRAWLMDGHGKTVWGPTPISTGRPGFDTPVAVTHVFLKEPYHWSTMHHADMYWAIFFNGDMAFHAMNTTDNSRPGWYKSHGCIRMTPDGAKHFYNYLQVGDAVEVVK
ncbi:MAG: L,D-transpeptidase [Nocardiaceae bacterium]|nr:L,D-transpeptidase [Nocardiaceae bacterium]